MTVTSPGPARIGAGARIAGAAALIAGLTVLARVAGFGRTAVFLWTVDDRRLGDIYNAANTIPNIVFELVAGGALASLVVPLLAGAVAAADRQKVDAITSALLTWALTLLVPLALVVAAAAAPIAGLLPDLSPDDRALAARMLRVFAPQLPLYGVGVVLTGVLQAHHRFAWPVIAPLLSSVTVMGAYLTYALVDGPGSDVRGLSRGGELALSLGTTAGVVVLALCLLVPLRRLRLRLRPSYRFAGDAGRQAVRLGWAGGVTVGAQQVMVAVVIALAVGDGDLTRFNAAQTVYLLPWAVLAVPLATAVYPALATAFSRGDEPGYRDALATTARSVVLLTCLGAAALVALAAPAAAVLGTPGSAAGIAGFAPGLIGYGLFALLSRALYARGATVAAAAATAAGWAAAVAAAFGLAAVFRDEQRVLALGLANAVGATAIGVLLVLAVRRHAGGAALAGLLKVTAVGLTAAVAAGAAGRACVGALDGRLPDTPTGAASVLQGMLGGVMVVVVFAAVAYPLDRRDVRPLLAVLGRRWSRRRRTPPPGTAATPAGTTRPGHPEARAGRPGRVDAAPDGEESP